MNFFSDPQSLLEETAIVERFCAYVAIDTQSDPTSKSCPSTDKQRDLAGKLMDELKSLGLKEVVLDDNCHVTARLPGTVHPERVVGLLAHLDTSPSVSGADVHPVRHEKYDGSILALKEGVTIDPEENPELTRYLGDTIITSDGTTLLGADDKAGIAVIMAAIEHFTRNPSLPHPTILVGFTPDEEIGRGTACFPLEDFQADVAYTIDGSVAGEINVETFEAYAMSLKLTGVSTHPGKGKGKLVNALRYMAKLIDRLPMSQSPEQTEKREGFIHPVDCTGDASECTLNLILRDFDKDAVRRLIKQVRAIAEDLADEEPRLEVEMEVDHTYPNMYQYLVRRPEIEQRLKEAVRLAGIEPIVEPVRGGTDGAVLTSQGLPCPNIFAGGMNLHSKREWIAARAMGLSLCVVLNLMMLHTQ